MGATTDKIKGTANEAVGKAKQGIGEATGSDRLQGEGVIQEVKGKGQKAMGDAKRHRQVRNGAALIMCVWGAPKAFGADRWLCD